MLAVPLSTYRWVNTNDDGRYSYGHYEYITKLMLVDVNESDGSLSVYGEVNHSSLFDTDGEYHWWDDRNIRRSIFMGDFVYAISSAGITATNLTSMMESDRLLLPRASFLIEDGRVESTGSTSDGEDREDGADGGSEGSDEWEAEGEDTDERERSEDGEPTEDDSRPSEA